MIKFDHLAMPVTDVVRSRAWYIDTLGLKVEFEIPERKTVALQDSDDFTIFLAQAAEPVQARGYAFWFQVDNVDAAFSEWSARGVEFSHPPRKNPWGYGAEVKDPDGHLIRLWDERSMKEK